MAAVNLLDLSIDVTQILLLVTEEFLGFLRHQSDQPHRNRQDHKCDQCHQRGDTQHHDQNADQRCHGCDNCGNALVQSLTQCVDIVGNAGEYFAIGAALKIFHRHAVDFLRDFLSEPIAYLLGNAGHNPALDEAEQGAHQIQAKGKQQNFSDFCKVNAACPPDFFHQSLRQCRCCFSENLRSRNVEHGRTCGTEHNDKNRNFILSDILCKLFDRFFQVLRLFARLHAAAHASHRSSFARLLISPVTHGQPPHFLFQAPSPKAGILQSPDKPYSSSAVLHVYLFRLPFRHRAPESAPHGELY